MSNPNMNSEYGAEGSFNLSSSVEEVARKGEVPFYSPIRLSGVKSGETKTGSSNTSAFPIENTKSSLKYDHSKHQVVCKDASGFVYKSGVVRYNMERGVDYTAPLLVGSKKLIGQKGERGYHPMHMVFDPRSGTLAAGYDIDNEWAHLPKFSLITGIGNSSQLDASLVSGSYNAIKLLKQGNEDEVSHVTPPSCAIIGGSNNTIANNSSQQGSTVIIGCKDVVVSSCESTAVIGLISTEEDIPIRDFKETTFMRDVYTLGLLNAGPFTDREIPEGTVLATNGNVLVRGNIAAHSASIKYLEAEEAKIGSAYIVKTDLYLEGLNGQTGITTVLNPSDNHDIVYVNPINGVINIYLGTGANNVFTPNREITFKDVTLEYGMVSSYNVNIIVPNTSGLTGAQQTRIEHYNGGGLTVGTNAGYSLNSSGGSVTFVFSRLPPLGSQPTWVIKNQFIGNPRVLGTSGIKFAKCTDNAKAKIIKR